MSLFTDIPVQVYAGPTMKLVQVYKCLCDETRLRILHLLSHRPLCVCHFQEILRAPQVKISKHLAYLREHALVETQKEGAWIIYSLPAQPSPELVANLKCLQDCCGEHAAYCADLKRMEKVLANCAGPLADCCSPRRKPLRESKQKASRKPARS
jgi:DNA-binding transcriptional ArsR family regulator